MLRRSVLLTAATMLLLAACGGDSEPEAAVEFGEGVLPESVPTDFPVPLAAVIGTTIVNHPQSYTEAQIRVPSTAPELVQFYTVALVNRGYVIDSSGETGGEWTIAFRKEDLEGRVEISTLSTEVASAFVHINTD